MYRTGIIFMVLEVGRRGALGSESKKMHRPAGIFMILEVGGKGVAGLRITRNA